MAKYSRRGVESLLEGIRSLWTRKGDEGYSVVLGFRL